MLTPAPLSGSANGEGEPMDFAYSAKVEELRRNLLDFMDGHIYPAEAVYAEQVRASGDPHFYPPVMEDLKKEARSRGLWNLFMPDEQYGAGLTNLEYAPLAEITGRSPHIAPEALNCAAPDTGNMEILAEYGTDEQRDAWLKPLLEGEIRSCFSMTEPEVASSDASNIQGRIVREGDHYVINARKWWSSGAADARCKRAIGMAERAYDLMCKRALTRVAFGKPLARQGVVQQQIARSRIEIEQARLLVLKAAWLMDTVGKEGARVEISAIKVAAPTVMLN